MTVQIATDGSGTHSGPGGWAAVIRCGDVCKEISGSVPEATNNTMEIMAAIMALRELKRPCTVQLTTDSEYLRNGATMGLSAWKRNGWVTGTGSPVKNRELWEQIDFLASRHEVEWIWVKGHSGHPDNERCDVLAGEARASLLPPKPEVKRRPKKPFNLDGLSDDAIREALAALPSEALIRLRTLVAA